MNPNVHDKFLRPLMALYRCDVPDQEAFFSELRRQLGNATDYQLEHAVNAIVRKHRYKTFPSLAEIIEVVDASPAAPPRQVDEAHRPTFTPSSRPPIVIAAERYIDDWERADERQRANMERGRGAGHILTCRHVVELWSRPDPGRKSVSDGERADQIGSRVERMFR